MAFTHEVETVFQGAQLGIEATWGTAVAATVKLAGCSIIPALKKNTKTYSFQGSTLPTLGVVDKEWTTLEVNGVATQQELGYFIKDVVSDAQSTPASYTIECGGQKAAGCVVTDWNIDGTREAINFKATMAGKKATTAAPTAGLTAVTPYPFPPVKTTITVGGTSYTKWFDWSIGMSGLWDTCWLGTDGDVSNVYQKENDGTFAFKVEADTAGLAPLALTGNQSVVVECHIGTTPNLYTLSFSFDAFFGEPSALEDSDGIYAIRYNAKIMNKATKAVTVVCTKA